MTRDLLENMQEPEDQRYGNYRVFDFQFCGVKSPIWRSITEAN